VCFAVPYYVPALTDEDRILCVVVRFPSLPVCFALPYYVPALTEELDPVPQTFYRVLLAATLDPALLTLPLHQAPTPVTQRLVPALLGPMRKAKQEIWYPDRMKLALISPLQAPLAVAQSPVILLFPISPSSIPPIPSLTATVPSPSVRNLLLAVGEPCHSVKPLSPRILSR